MTPSQEKILKKKIYFVHTGLVSFVKTDLEILKEAYNVSVYHYHVSGSLLGKFRNILSSFWHSLTEVPKSDVVYVWFGGYHGFFPAFFSKILRKKSIIIVGGYDASYVPSINYGVFYTKGFLLWCIKRVYQWATYLCPTDECLVKSINYYADPTGKGYPIGLLNHIDIDEQKIKVIHLGYACDEYKIKNKLPNTIVSVAVVDELNTFKLKGLDIVISCAEKMKDYNFTIIGLNKDIVQRDLLPQNVTVKSRLSFADLKEELGSQMFILHPSRTESFCSAIVEGMLSGCVPIGSNVGGIKRSIGDTGYVIELVDVDAYVAAINDGLMNQAKLGYEARERAMTLYPVNKRKSDILDIING